MVTVLMRAIQQSRSEQYLQLNANDFDADTFADVKLAAVIVTNYLNVVSYISDNKITIKW